MHKLKIVILCMTLMLSADLLAQNVTIGTDAGAPVTLSTVIEAIESQTDWSFVYDRSQVDVSVPVTLKRRTASVRNMLDDIFGTVGGVSTPTVCRARTSCLSSIRIRLDRRPPQTGFLSAESSQTPLPENLCRVPE